MEDLVNDTSIDYLDDFEYYTPKRWYSILTRKEGIRTPFVFTHIWASSVVDCKEVCKRLGLETKGKARLL